MESGKWQPTDKTTGNRHRCQLPQICGTCNDEFMGSPWMKTCPKCYKADQPNTRGFTQPRDNSETGNFGEAPGRSKSRYGRQNAVPVAHEPVNLDQPGIDYDDIPF